MLRRHGPCCAPCFMVVTDSRSSGKRRWLALGMFALLGCGQASPVETKGPSMDPNQLCGSIGISCSPPCRIAARWGSLSKVSCAAEVDGPYLYVEDGSGQIRANCCGLCGPGPNCPPPEWTCGN